MTEHAEAHTTRTPRTHANAAVCMSTAEQHPHAPGSKRTTHAWAQPSSIRMPSAARAPHMHARHETRAPQVQRSMGGTLSTPRRGPGRRTEACAFDPSKHRPVGFPRAGCLHTAVFACSPPFACCCSCMCGHILSLQAAPGSLVAFCLNLAGGAVGPPWVGLPGEMRHLGRSLAEVRLSSAGRLRRELGARQFGIAREVCISAPMCMRVAPRLLYSGAGRSVRRGRPGPWRRGYSTRQRTPRLDQARLAKGGVRGGCNWDLPGACVWVEAG